MLAKGAPHTLSQEYDGSPITPVDWRNKDGINQTTHVRNQHIPQQCGSCWAFAGTSALSDRISIARGGTFPTINLAPQVIISCVTEQDGCQGGDQPSLQEQVKANGLVEESCSNQQAKGWKSGNKCSDSLVCKDCYPGKGCNVPDSYNVFTVDTWGSLSADTAPNGDNVTAMKLELAKNGPLACGIDANPIHAGTFDPKHIFEDAGNEIDHDISIVGWAEDPKLGNYWIVRNSWGSTWGDNGFFQVRQGTNALLLETNCYWATVKQDWKNEKQETTFNRVTPTKPLKLQNPEVKPKHQACSVIKKDRLGAKNSTLTPVTLPEAHFWGDIKGVNQLSWTKQQHIPQYCGSCWAQGSTSALADRTNILVNNSVFWNLSPQVVMNCNAGGSCDGGDPYDVYQFANTHGIPHDSCQTYLASNPADATCDGQWICQDCNGPPGQSECQARTPVQVYASDFGNVSGIDDMKQEIFQRGPIACGIAATDNFVAYTGGIQSEKTDAEIDHIISLVGFGKDAATGTEQWVGRNSWGSHWGENGFFRIQMHTDNLLVETSCVWAVPTLEKPASAVVYE